MSKKRSASHLESDDSGAVAGVRKVAKGEPQLLCIRYHLTLSIPVHPFFTKPSASSSTASFQWLKPSLGPKRSCLHGINLVPQSRSKVAAFDLDGTVIKSNHKNRSKEAALHWEWWRAIVPTKLQELHQEGYVLMYAKPCCNSIIIADTQSYWYPIKH